MNSATLVPMLAAGLQLVALVVALEVALSWVQPDHGRWPRWPFHRIAEPLLRPLRMISRVGDWDLSPLLLLTLVGVLRVALVRA